MSAQREYFLRHLGIGEIWTLRQTSTMLDFHGQRDGIGELDMSASLSSSPESEALRLQQEIALCEKCSLCQIAGKQAWDTDALLADILIVHDWSEPEFFERQKAQEYERLVSNVLKTMRVEGARIAAVSLLNSQMPKTNLKVPTQDSSQHCGVFLDRILRLSQARQLFVFGAKAANVLMRSQHDIQQLRSMPLSFNNTPMTVTFSPYELLENGQLKREIWQDWCRVRTFLT